MKVGDIVRVKEGVNGDNLIADCTHLAYLYLKSFKVGRFHPKDNWLRIEGDAHNWIHTKHLELVPEGANHAAPPAKADVAGVAPEAAIIAAAPAKAIEAGDRVKFLGRKGIERFKGGWKRKYEQYVGQVFTVAKKFEDGVTFNHPLLAGEFFDLRSVLLTGDAPVALHVLSPIEEVATKIPQAPFTGICQFALKKKSGDWIVHKSAPCHAQLQVYEGDGAEYGITNVVYYIANQVKAMPDEIKKLYPQYADYVVNRSPWAKAFLPRTGYEIARSGVEANVDAPRSWVAAGAVALREGTEFTGRLGVFDRIRKEGFSEHVAYLISFMVQLPKGQADGKLGLSGMGGGHMAMSCALRMSRVIDFFKNSTLQDTGKEYMEIFRIKAGAYKIHKCIDVTVPDWGGGDGANSLGRWAKTHLSGTKTGTGWDAKTVLTWEEVFAAALVLEQAFKEAK